MIDNALWLFAMCLVLGSGVGLLAGLLGIGGGLVVVPALVWLLPRVGIDSELVMHIALATSLASIVLTSGSSARNHIRLGNVDFSIVKTLAPGVIIGGLGNIRGVVMAALLIGMTRALGYSYAPSWVDFLTFVLLIGTLILRPEGLFSRKGRTA